jgi:hypothetical protein
MELTVYEDFRQEPSATPTIDNKAAAVCEIGYL